MAFVRRELAEMSPTVDANLIQSMINLMESMLEEVYVDADSHAMAELKKGSGASKSRKKAEVKNHDEVIESCFLFSLVWSVGAPRRRTWRRRPGAQPRRAHAVRLGAPTRRKRRDDRAARGRAQARRLRQA